jgi:hypothetical protein
VRRRDNAHADGDDITALPALHCISVYKITRWSLSVGRCLRGETVRCSSSAGTRRKKRVERSYASGMSRWCIEVWL